MPETVWALHNFEAEAEDEISFHIGEPIIVLQKDELYQDGWWEGTNVNGETGLFPMNYTAENPPDQAIQPPVDGPAFPPGDISQPNAVLTNNGANSSGMLAHQSLSSLASNMNNMHVSQNPVIATPSTTSAHSRFPSAASTAVPNSQVIAQNVEDSLADPQLQTHPLTWTIDQVAYWLGLCGYGSVAQSFIDNEISGPILLELNLNNLKELDITSFGKRFNIMSSINALKQLTKIELHPKSSFGTLSNSLGSTSFVGAHPNVPPRTASVGPSPRASFDVRSDYMRDPRHDVQDLRNMPTNQPPQQVLAQPTTHRSQQQHMHQSPEHEVRSAGLGRSDTIGSIMSGGSMGEYPIPTGDVRGAQRQSVTSAFSGASNPHRGQPYTQNQNRSQQALASAAHHQPPRGSTPANFEEDPGFRARAKEQQHSMDQYPRAMDRNGSSLQDTRFHESLSPEMYHPTPKPRQYHQPDNTNRPMNGKADPSDKVVPLDMIGKPDYAGWLKKRGDTYRTWKSRWFMLKGVTLYYMNSPKDNASKDYINLVGYKIIQDENIYAGKYCFKAVHDDLRNFYFYTESESDMKGWLKALMKVTIGRDPTAPVISSSNIPTIPLHVARQLRPRPPSPSKRVRSIGANGQPIATQQQLQQQQLQHQHQQQQQQHHQQQQHQHGQRPQQQQPQKMNQKNPPMQLLDYDSESEDYLPNEYGGPRATFESNRNGNGGASALNTVIPESPIVPGATSHQQQQQQRFSFIPVEHPNEDDDPWRDEDGEGFVHSNKRRENQPPSNQKMVRPDSELDTVHPQNGMAHPMQGAPSMSREQYVQWINRNLPSGVEPVPDMTQSLRSGVVLVRLIEQLSGEQVDKRIPNATYTLQMLENLLTAFKFMDRVGISTDGYTVKDIFNGNEEKIIMMFESIRSTFPDDAAPSSPKNDPVPTATSGTSSGPVPATSTPTATATLSVTDASSLRGSPRPNGGAISPAPGQQPGGGQRKTPQQWMQSANPAGSEFEALYDEAARSTVN